MDVFEEWCDQQTFVLHEAFESYKLGTKKKWPSIRGEWRWGLVQEGKDYSYTTFLQDKIEIRETKGGSRGLIMNSIPLSEIAEE